jgi:hypothetical protein
MVNGKHVAGQGLSGATVTIQGRSAVLSQASGAFSFPVTNKSFMVQGVKKHGYQLVDADATRRSYQYSQNTFYILMETPEQQTEDKLTAERKIRRTLQRQLQQREDELEELKEQNKLTQEEYRRKLQQLYDDQQNNEKLISEMAKRYSELDYDQMDELNRQISDAILDGELTRADSLLRSKGDIRQRAEELKQHEQANEQVRKDLEKSEALAKQRRDDLARDCYSRFELCKMKNEHDSAAYYIELRADVDTLNVKYQVDAAGYLEGLNYTRRAGGYYKRAFTMLFNKSEEEKQKYTYNVVDMIRAYMGIARALFKEGAQETGIKIYELILNSMIDTEKQILENDPTVTVYNIPIAFMQLQLAGFYRQVSRYEDCEKIYMKALERLQSHQGDQEVVESDLADIQSGLASLYFQTKRYEECEAVSAKAVAIYRKMLEAEQTEDIQNALSNALYTQGKLYRNLERYDECERAFLECSSIRKSLAEKNPQSYQSAYSWSLSQLASEYVRQKRYEDAYQQQDSVYFLRRQLCRWQLEKYKDDLIAAMGTLSYYAILTKRFKLAEDVAENALEGDSTKQWIKVNLAAALLLQGKYINAKSYYQELDEKHKKAAIDGLQKIAENGIIPPEYEADVETIKRMLEE